MALTVAALLTPAILLALGWILLGGIVAWSPQTQLLVIIGVAVWLMIKK